MRDNSAAGTIVINKTKYFACAEPLTLYDRNAPFSNEHWLLLGIVPNSTLYKSPTICRACCWWQSC